MRVGDGRVDLGSVGGGSRVTPGAVRRVRSVVATLTVLAATGCSSSAPTSEGTTGSSSITPSSGTPAPTLLGTIVVSERRCKVDGVASPVTAGPVALTIVNETDDFAMANMSKILEGGTYQDLAAHITEEIRLAEHGKPGLNHPDYAPPSFELSVRGGGTSTLTGEVSEGTYAIVCGRTYEEVDEVRPSDVSGPYRVE